MRRAFFQTLHLCDETFHIFVLVKAYILYLMCYGRTPNGNSAFHDVSSLAATILSECCCKGKRQSSPST